MTPAIGSSPWWITHLGKALDSRARTIEVYDRYYEGEHNLLFASAKWREAFGNLFGKYAENVCGVVVDAIEERLNVDGFRMGRDRDLKADTDAWYIWQANQLDAESSIAFTEMLVKGVVYAMVWASDNPKAPAITFEDASEMIVETAAGNRRQRLAALKKWRDESGQWMCTLYFPDRIEKYQAKGKVDGNGWERPSSNADGWEKRAVPGEVWPLPNPLGVVPVVPIENRSRLSRSPSSELKAVVPIQNAINKLAADMLVSAEFTAFRQRWATGVEIPVDPDTGKQTEPWKAAVDRVWIGNPPDDHPDWKPQFGEFGETDLSNYIKAIEQRLQLVGTIKRLPQHYLVGNSGSPASAESLVASETGLVALVQRKEQRVGEDLEEVIRLAFRVMGDDRADIVDSETIWRDPRFRSESEHVDAIVKQRALGIPDEALWEELGYTSTQIARFKQMRLADALTAAASFDPFREVPAPTPVPVPTSTAA